MIGIDTNILVRAYLEDDKHQAQEAQAFLLKATNENSLFISSYAILEFSWVLKVKGYSRKEIYEAIIALIDAAGIVVSQKDVVLEALAKYISGKADFGDYMIWADGEKHRSRQLKTFDVALQKELQEQNLG